MGPDDLCASGSSLAPSLCKFRMLSIMCKCTTCQAATCIIDLIKKYKQKIILSHQIYHFSQCRSTLESFGNSSLSDLGSRLWNQPPEALKSSPHFESCPD